MKMTNPFTLTLAAAAALVLLISVLAPERSGADVQAPFSRANLVPLQRIDQSGAADGQVPTWSAAQGMWVAGQGSGNTNSAPVQNFYVTSNFVDYITSVSNTSVTINTNVTVNNNVTISGHTTINDIIITNGVALLTKTWGGPSNALVFNGSGTPTNDYFFASASACAITSTTIGAGLTEWSSLVLSNSAATNWLLTIPASYRLAPGLTNQPTVTNGTMIDLDLKHYSNIYTTAIYTFF